MESLKWKKKWCTQQISGSISRSSFEGNRSIAVFWENKKVGREWGHPFVHPVNCTEKKHFQGGREMMGKQQGWEMKIQGGRWRERKESERGALWRRSGNWGFLSEKAAGWRWRGGRKNLSASGLCYVCVPGEEGYYGLGVCASGEVGSVCCREGQERRERERNMVKAIKPPKGSSRVLRNTFLTVSWMALFIS